MFKTGHFVLALALFLATAPPAWAQILIPTQAHDTLDLELHSLRDKVTLYMGDPQELLRMHCRPVHVEPRVEYSSQARAILRIRDQQLFQKQPADLDQMPEKKKEKYLSDPQTWELRLYPSGPTKFTLVVDDGEGIFDFTDFAAQEVRVKTQNTKVDVEFGRPNPIEMELFAAATTSGSIECRQLLNARAKTIAFVSDGSTCDVELTGKEYDGETEVLFEGAADEIGLVVSRKVGLRVDGPAEMLAHFESKHMAADGESLVSQDFEKAKCRIRLSFSQTIEKMKVKWD